MYLCCGDALFDLFFAAADTSVSSGSVSLAGNVGGSPMNVASGLARLGHQSSYFTKLSSDPFGQRMRQYLEDNSINTGLCIDSPLNTTLAIVETKEDGSASYVFYTDNTADVSIHAAELPDSLPDQVEVLHFGSYSTAVEPTGQSLLQLAEREKGRRLISYDPNLRPTIEPDIEKWREVVAGFSRQADLIKASDEDIQTLLGPNAEDKFVADCFNAGAQLVFITRGADGASGYRPDGQSVNISGVSAQVVDTVGAGDTFQACLLHWLKAEGHLEGSQSRITGEVDLEACMALAARAAAITCTRAGADLPTLAEIQSA